MAVLVQLLLLVVAVASLQVNQNQRKSPRLNYVSEGKEFISDQRGEPQYKDFLAQVLKNGKVQIRNVHELRAAVLDEGHALKNIESQAEFSTEQVLSHDVLDLMVQRFRSKSTPGNRTDGATLAISIEGGGMRGAVSAGMAAAIYALGFIDTIDVIYGSSAGSLIGAYMVTRQLSVDVYTDLLPNSKGQFVCKKRLVSSLLSNFAEQVWGLPKLYEKPGMNVSYVMDTILPEKTGLRPLDMEAFEYNNKHQQQLRVATSCVDEHGNLASRCFGTDDFTDDTTSNTGRKGLFACMEASMTVPGATGAPVEITSKHRNNSTIKAFDAFCFEPLPYRSAVEEGATHVLVLRSRPQDYEPKTKPSIYETTVAPLYFQSHGEPGVAEFFRRGGQQYIYLEDHLTLEEGRLSNEAVPIPPSTEIHYGVDGIDRGDRETWKKAHVFPMVVPHGTPELKTLEQDAQVIIEAVRGGFAAAFDLLAPAIGLDVIDSKWAAELVFPSAPSAQTSVRRPTAAEVARRKRVAKGLFGVKRGGSYRVSEENIAKLQALVNDEPSIDHYNLDETALKLLQSLPAIGNLPSLHACLVGEERR
jgi:predicted patatin/cPLA2 family phospholipase